jgi:hypothetical protein
VRDERGVVVVYVGKSVTMRYQYDLKFESGPCTRKPMMSYPHDIAYFDIIILEYKIVVVVRD